MKKSIILFGVFLVVLAGAYGAFAWWQNTRPETENGKIPTERFDEFVATTTDKLVTSDELTFSTDVNLEVKIKDQSGEAGLMQMLVGKTYGLDFTTDMQRDRDIFAFRFRLNLAKLMDYAEQVESALVVGSMPEEQSAQVEEIVAILREDLHVTLIWDGKSAYFSAPETLGDTWYSITRQALLADLAENENVEVDAEAMTEWLNSMSDPKTNADIVKIVTDSLETPTLVAEEEIDGHKAARFRAVVDPKRLYQNSLTYVQDRAEQGDVELTEQEIRFEEYLDEIVAEFWFDVDSGLLQKMQYTIPAHFQEFEVAISAYVDVASAVDYSPAAAIEIPNESTSWNEYDIEKLPDDCLVSRYYLLYEDNLQSANEQSGDSRRKADLNEVKTAMELYYDDHMAYPTPTDYAGLAAVLTPDYLRQLPVDPVETSAYRYYGDEQAFELGVWLEAENEFFTVQDSVEMNLTIPAAVKGVSPYTYDSVTTASEDEEAEIEEKKDQLEAALQQYFDDHQEYPNTAGKTIAWSEKNPDNILSEALRPTYIQDIPGIDNGENTYQTPVSGAGYSLCLNAKGGVNCTISGALE